MEQSLLTVFHLVGVKHWQQLAVERHERGPYEIGRHDELLNNFQRNTHHLHVARVERICDGESSKKRKGKQLKKIVPQNTNWNYLQLDEEG